MTENELELRHWLNRAFYADKKLRTLRAAAEQCREHAQGLTRSWEGKDKGKSDGAENGTEAALMRLADMELRCTRQIAELVTAADEVSAAISLLRNDDLETVLIHRYILFHTIEQTAEELNYAPRTVRAKQKAAIEKLCLLMPCFACK